MTNLASIMDANTLVPLGTVFGALLIVAGICWRMASVKAEYSADLRHLKAEMCKTNTTLENFTAEVNREMGQLWGANTQLVGRVGKVEGRLNGRKG